MGGEGLPLEPSAWPRKLAKPSPRRGEVKRVLCKGSALRLWGSAKVRTYGPSSLIWKCDKGKTPLEASEHSWPPSWILSSARWGRGRRHKEASRFAGKGLKGGGAADARSLPRRFRLRVWEASGLKPSASGDGAQQRVCIARFAMLKAQEGFCGLKASTRGRHWPRT